LNRKELGKLGEKYALDYLRSNNYEIIKVNYRCRYGEIDIIAKEKNILVFVEVKTRTSDAFGKGLEAVDAKKQRKIKQVALYFLNNYRKPVEDLRFDVIDVNIAPGHMPELFHLKHAF